ncbi:MAG TPA: hypothetical protein VM262_09620 [Acidimicrobiales bacterium]|nr:hypothetical protein [Acidimicrobiales bacterium]
MVGRCSTVRRTAVVALVSALALAGVQLTSPAASGQEPFAAGSGRAAAKLVKVGPARGALTLAPQFGLALADFLNTRGRGDVRTADFAALEDSVPPEIRAALPTVKVESTDDDAETGETVTVGTPPEVPLKLGGAELHADAGPAPYGASSFTAGALDLGVGTMSGARAESRTGVVDGRVREAVARVVIPRLELADGAVVLENLTWLAVQRTGGEQVEQATFSVGAATVAGQSLAAPSGGDLPLEDVAAAVAPVLAPLGIELTFPVARIDKGAVALSPLRLRLRASDAAPALVPITEGVQPVREPLVDAIREGSDGQVDAGLLLADIGLGVVTGGSTLDIELGGVIAVTAEPAAGFRFGTAGGFALGATGGGSSLGGTGRSTTGGGGLAAPSAATSPAAAGSSVPAGSGSGGVALDATPTSSSEERGGPLLAVGIIGLLAAAAAAIADLRKVRTGRRIIPV